MDVKVLELLKAEALEHPHVLSAKVDSKECCLITRIGIPLPQADEPQGVSKSGVRAEEDVKWLIPHNYPFEAPYVMLRKDFPCDFPHINPNKEDVSPCILEGSLKELLQQPKGFLGVLDQMVAWLRKAAMDELMDTEQGWVPMRNDDANGLFPFEESAIDVRIWDRNGVEVVDYCNCKLLIVLPNINAIYNRYIPNKIQNLSDLKSFCKLALDENTYCKLLENLKNLPCNSKNKGYVFVGIRRPCHIIGKRSNIEWLAFMVDIEYGGKKKMVVDRSRTSLLTVCEKVTPELLNRLSGCSRFLRGRIVQVGCGSLGSKISLHLARNGNDRFVFVDNDIFKAHNNARHSLMARSPIMKADLMRQAVQMLGEEAEAYPNLDGLAATPSENDLLIDSTASMAFRNELASNNLKCRIVHTALYNKGTYGVFLVEGSERNPRVDDLFAYVMRRAVLDGEYAIDFAAIDQETVIMGQSCSSVTTIMEDARISVHAAGMAMKMQNLLTKGFSNEGIVGCSTEENCSVKWNWRNVNKTWLPLKERIDGFSVRILSEAIIDMKKLSLQFSPNEVGGFIAGIVNRNTKTITVIKCLPPPKDCISTPTSFLLGFEGAKRHAKKIEKESGGMVTYLGTWHSHPVGGSASSTDKATYEKLFERRNFPTLCMIWKGDDGLECIP